MKTFINQSKRVYIIGDKRIEPNTYFTLTNEEYNKVKCFNEIKPLFVEEEKKEIKNSEEKKEKITSTIIKNKNKNKHK